MENGSSGSLDDENRNLTLNLWKSRERRVLYSLANCAILQKDFESAVSVLESLLKLEDASKLPKIHSAMGRVFLQLGKFQKIFVKS